MARGADAPPSRLPPASLPSKNKPPVSRRRDFRPFRLWKTLEKPLYVVVYRLPLHKGSGGCSESLNSQNASQSSSRALRESKRLTTGLRCSGLTSTTSSGNCIFVLQKGRKR